MNILVTGIAGAIGSHVAERLKEEGHNVFGIDALTDYYSPAIKKITINDLSEKGIKTYIKNLVSDDISDIVADSDVIFHFAAQPGISSTTSFDEYLNNNIVATNNLLEEIKKNPDRLKLFVNISTSSVYGRIANSSESAELKPTSNYGVTKLAAEQLALSYNREFGIPVTVLRLFSVYGERERPEKLYHKLIRAIYEDKDFPLYEGSKEHIRSYTYVSDIVDGCMKVLENHSEVAGEIFNLGTDKTNTTGEGIEIIESIIGKKAKILNVPKRAGDQKETSADIEKAKKILGYSPKIDLKTGLEAEVRWFEQKIFNKVDTDE